jgi:two-component system LytT family response regulator
MPGGDGFSLLRRFGEISFDVVFVTSFDKYAINAIRFSALDYLLKPIEINDLDGAVMKAIRLVEQRSLLNVKIGNLLHNVEPDRLNRKLAVHVRDKVVLVPILDVMYIIAESIWCHIHTADGEHYMMIKILKEFEDFLEEYPSFIRVHKSFIINTAFIHDYSKGKPCILAMKGGRTFEVARRKKQEVLEKIQRLH